MRNRRSKLILATVLALLVLALTACTGGDVGTDEDGAAGDTPPRTLTTAPPPGDSSSSVEPTIPWAPQPHPKTETPVEPTVIDGFVKVTDIDATIVIDLRYATTDNFTGQVVYPTDTCVLRLATARKLAEANAQVSQLGYRIKVWDAYRPFSVQEIFWEIYPDSRYVANPSTGGSIHNRGCAVDITLVDSDGDELVMPTGFDDFSSQASPSSPDMSAEARANLDILRQAMFDAGFQPSTSEWWHFKDSDYRNYPIADVDLSQF